MLFLISERYQFVVLEVGSQDQLSHVYSRCYLCKEYFEPSFLRDAECIDVEGVLPFVSRNQWQILLEVWHCFFFFEKEEVVKIFH